MHGFIVFDCGFVFGEVGVRVFVEVKWGHVDDVEGVVVLVELAAAEEHLRDFLHGDAGGVVGAFLLEGGAADEEAFVLLHGFADGIETLHGEELGGGVDVVVLRTLTLLPVEGAVWLIGVAFLFRHRCGKHVSRLGASS